MTIYGNLDKDIKILKENLKSNDVLFTPIMVAENKGIIIFIKNIVDKKSIGELILSPLKDIKKITDKNNLLESFSAPDKQLLSTHTEIIDSVLSGYACIIIDNYNFAISFGVQKISTRSITEPPTSTVIKGPREGFVESISTNISLLRKRLITPDLIVDNLNVGKFSKTKIAIVYIDKIADKNLVQKVKQKIQSISIDAVLDSSYISKYISEHKTAIFKQVGNTEKPDILTAKILEGRVAIFVDGSPIVLTVPYLLIEDFQSPSDYYNSSYSGTIQRLIRLFAVSVALLLPAFFVSAELFHLQLIPLSFLLTIVNSIKGIPLSPSYEMFFTLLIFEILNETSVRMPKYVGMAVSIVGGLVLGETAVNAGIISAPTLMIIAFSGICLYTVPELVQSFSLLRLLLLIVAGSFGLFGLLTIISILLI